jgi:hypothetical protein
MTPATCASLLLAALLVIAPAGASLSGSPLEQPSAAADARRIDAIREALLRLPYYGVFDFLTFAYEKGTVRLGGYAFQPSLIRDAERAVKRVSGVDTVVVEIKALPASLNDDDIRWRVFYAIYTNEFLSKYAIASGAMWGHRHPYRSPMSRPFSAFPGMQPTGNYPIHIVVEGGRVRLLGVVDNEADKTVAGLAARGVSGTFGLDNDLVVETP